MFNSSMKLYSENDFLIEKLWEEKLSLEKG